MKPHDAYANAVMKALGDLYDPAESWTAYDCDDGEVMLMEIVITLNPDKARTAGYPEGLVLLWDQRHGWTWVYVTEPGRNSEPSPLVGSATCCTPEDVARAALQLLSPGGSEALPIAGQQPDTATMPPDLQEILDELPNVLEPEDCTDITDTVRALAAYR